jgi:hypothetical protein
MTQRIALPVVENHENDARRDAANDDRGNHVAQKSFARPASLPGQKIKKIL